MPVSRTALAVGPRVYLRYPRAGDARAFIAAATASRRLHGLWVQAPTTPTRFRTYVRRFGGPKARDAKTATHIGLLACRREDDALVGVFNFSEIVRGGFQSTYLGYYAMAPHAGVGYMSEGLELALQAAFRVFKLHRVEVNIQPANTRSTTLIRPAGFVREGFSRRYVKIAGRWRDHERWALLVEDWRARRKSRR